MLTKLLPLVFLVFGTGIGVSAALYMTPEEKPPTMKEENTGQNLHSNAKEANAPPTDSHGNDIASPTTEFVKLNNQFVIPVVENDVIAALVVVSLSLETLIGNSEKIYAREPKLRDAFLRVLFDHANMGGFHGAFTSAQRLDLLRSTLREVAQKELGPSLIDVLIVEIIRQDT